MKSWPPLPVRESTIIPLRLPLKQATPDISWGRRSRSASRSWRETSTAPREGDQSAAANRRTSRLSVSAAVPLKLAKLSNVSLKLANDGSGVDGRDRDRKPTVMVVWVILLVLAIVALLLFSYQKERKKGIALRGGTDSEDDAIRDPVNATRGHPTPPPSPHIRITRRTSLHEATTTTGRPASSSVVTTTADKITSISSIRKPPAAVKKEDEMTSTSSAWEPPVNGTNATAVDETGG
ncbi:hypothetical protein MTO96_031958 [Rhipicephalus appendiculatus]